MHTEPTCGESNESTDCLLYKYVFFQTADPGGSVFRVRIPQGGMDVCLLFVSDVCCKVEVCATGRSFVEGCPTKCVSECYLKTVMRRRKPNRAVEPLGGGALFEKHRKNVRIFVAFCGHNYTT